MFIASKQKRFSGCFRAVVAVVLTAFIATGFVPEQYALAQGFDLPMPGTMVKMTGQFMPAMIKGIKVDPQNPLQFEFLIDPGQVPLGQNEKKSQYLKLIKYFLASLTTPEKDMWVNLSPYEHNRIISRNFGITEMGRDMLAQDYILKQLAASLVYPEDDLGKKFWDKVYERVRMETSGVNVPVNTFNKVWIIPQSATIFEKGNVAMITESHLKVMMEEDYLSLDRHGNAFKMGLSKASDTVSHVHQTSSEVMREIIIPAIEKEVNEGKNFAQLRQMYNAMVLASWFKQRLKMHLLSRIYVNQNKVEGVQLNNPQENEQIFQRYIQAYKKGVYNYIKEDVDPVSKEIIPRKYFSGGAAMKSLGYKMNRRGSPLRSTDNAQMAENEISSLDMAMVQLSAIGDTAQLAHRSPLRTFFLMVASAVALALPVFSANAKQQVIPVPDYQINAQYMQDVENGKRTTFEGVRDPQRLDENLKYLEALDAKHDANEAVFLQIALNEDLEKRGSKKRLVLDGEIGPDTEAVIQRFVDEVTFKQNLKLIGAPGVKKNTPEADALLEMLRKEGMPGDLIEAVRAYAELMKKTGSTVSAVASKVRGPVPTPTPAKGMSSPVVQISKMDVNVISYGHRLLGFLRKREGRYSKKDEETYNKIYEEMARAIGYNSELPISTAKFIYQLGRVGDTYAKGESISKEVIESTADVLDNYIKNHGVQSPVDKNLKIKFGVISYSHKLLRFLRKREGQYSEKDAETYNKIYDEMVRAVGYETELPSFTEKVIYGLGEMGDMSTNGKEIPKKAIESAADDLADYVMNAEVVAYGKALLEFLRKREGQYSKEDGEAYNEIYDKMVMTVGYIKQLSVPMEGLIYQFGTMGDRLTNGEGVPEEMIKNAKARVDAFIKDSTAPYVEPEAVPAPPSVKVIPSPRKGASEEVVNNAGALLWPLVEAANFEPIRLPSSVLPAPKDLNEDLSETVAVAKQLPSESGSISPEASPSFEEPARLTALSVQKEGEDLPAIDIAEPAVEQAKTETLALPWTLEPSTFEEPEMGKHPRPVKDLTEETAPTPSNLTAKAAAIQPTVPGVETIPDIVHSVNWVWAGIPIPEEGYNDQKKKEFNDRFNALIRDMGDYKRSVPLQAVVKVFKTIREKLEVGKNISGKLWNEAYEAVYQLNHHAALNHPVLTSQVAPKKTRNGGQVAAKKTRYGGIDFDSKYLQMNMQGNPIDMPVPKGFKWLLDTSIRGFNPEILDIHSGMGFELPFFKGILTPQEQRTAKEKILTRLAASVMDHQYVMKQQV